MRGLTERLAYANITIAGLICGTPDDFALDSLFYDAKRQGILDYREGCFDAPHLYQATSYLLDAWQEGQNFAADLDEMAHCDSCRAAHGDPCPYHG